MKTILSHNITQFITTVIILLSAYIIIYPPKIEILERTSEYAPILMFGMLFLSFVFIIFNQKRLMFISMMATAFIAFYLKVSSNDNLILPQQNQLPSIKVAHFNLSSVSKDDLEIEKILMQVDADVVTFQEFTPDWERPLATMLMLNYPHSYKMMRADPFGIAVFSKKSFKNIETFKYNNIPNLTLTVDNNMQDIDIISAYIPLFYPGPNLNRENHLNAVTEQIQQSENPVIVLGDYSRVYWQSEMIRFRNINKLNNSRRSTALSSPNPYDHIFYTEELECIQFDEITEMEQNHIGITGTYQTNLRGNKKQNFRFEN